MSDYEFLAIKEFDGKLIHLVSSEFTGNAAQISYTVPSGKTFYHLKSKLDSCFQLLQILVELFVIR